jgi:peroxiredoxin
MISSAHYARLGLGAVCLVFISTLGVLGGRAIERVRSAGELAPGFSLSRLNGESVSLSSLRGKIVVLVFSAGDSQISSHYQGRIVKLSQELGNNDLVRFLTIETACQNLAVVEELRVFKGVSGQTFPVLLDVDGQVTAKYGVDVAPTVMVIDPQGLIRYRGAFDDSRDEAKVKNQYCADAVKSLLAKRPITTTFTQAFGCPVRPK